MTTQQYWRGTTIVAGADLTVAGSLYKAIAVAGTIAPSNTTAIGLLQSKAGNGNHVTVGVRGEMKGWAGASIALGAKLMVTTSGFLITATSGTSLCGKALEAANSGDLFRGAFEFANVALS